MFIVASSQGEVLSRQAAFRDCSPRMHHGQVKLINLNTLPSRSLRVVHSSSLKRMAGSQGKNGRGVASNS